MACELEEAPLAVAEMTETEAIEAADYTARHYFAVDARTFLSDLHAGKIAPDDSRVDRVLSMIAPVQHCFDAR